MATILKGLLFLGVTVAVLTGLVLSSDVIFGQPHQTMPSEMVSARDSAEHMDIVRQIGKLEGRIGVVEKYGSELQQANIRERLTRIEETMRLMWIIAAGIGMLLLERIPGVFKAIIKATAKEP